MEEDNECISCVDLYDFGSLIQLYADETNFSCLKVSIMMQYLILENLRGKSESDEDVTAAYKSLCEGAYLDFMEYKGLISRGVNNGSS